MPHLTLRGGNKNAEHAYESPYVSFLDDACGPALPSINLLGVSSGVTVVWGIGYSQGKPTLGCPAHLLDCTPSLGASAFFVLAALAVV